MQQKLNHIGDKTHYYAAVLFLMWPVMAMVSAFRNFRKSWAKNIFWAFCAFYGFAYAIGAETSGSDIVRYVARLERLHGMEMSFAIAMQYFADSGEIDVLNIFLTILISLFTDSQAVFTMVYGFIFGFFFSRNVWYVLDRLEGKLQYITMLLIFSFLLVNPIWNITGIRMWTAVHIFVYGALPYLFEGKIKGLFIACLSILVHYSMMMPVLVLILYTFAGNRLTIYFSFFVLTLFVSELDITAFNRVIENYAPEIIQERSSSYRSEGQVESYREGDPESSRRWYAVWYGTALRWAVVGFLIFIFINGREFLNKNDSYLSLASFALLFYGVANLFSSLPSGGRYYVIANMCALALIILYIQNEKQDIYFKKFSFMTVPALLLFIIVAIRIGVYSLSPTALFGNPIVAYFTAGQNISLNDVMRMIL